MVTSRRTMADGNGARVQVSTPCLTSGSSIHTCRVRRFVCALSVRGSTTDKHMHRPIRQENTSATSYPNFPKCAGTVSNINIIGVV